MLPAILAGLGRAAAAGGAAAELGGATEAAAGLSSVNKQVGQLGQVCQTASPHISKLAEIGHKAFSKLTEGLTAVIDVVKASAAPIAQLVAIHNPARVEAFTRALNDAYGVVGRLLTPVMDAFTRAARKVGDALATIEPLLEPAMSAVADLVDVVADGFAQMVADLAPVTEMLFTAIAKVVEVVTLAVRVFGALASIVNSVVGGIAEALGFDAAKANKGASAVGAGHREARFVGPKQISDDAIKSSLMQGIARQTPTENKLDKIHGTLKDFYDAARRKWGQVEKGAEIATDVGGPTRKAIGQAAGQSDNEGSLVRWGLAQNRKQ